MEPVLAVEPVIISPWLTPSKSPCQVLSDVTRVMLFAFSKSVGSAGVILMSKDPLAWTMCISFWAATLSARLIPAAAAAAATRNLTLIAPLPATWPPIPKPVFPRRLATVARSPGGRVLHWLGVLADGHVRARRRASERTGFAGCASRLGRRRVTAFYRARFERLSYVEFIPPYIPQRRCPPARFFT